MIHKQMKAVLDSHDKLIEDLRKNIERARTKEDELRGEPPIDLAVQLKERQLEVLRTKHQAQATSMERLRHALEERSVEIQKLEAEIARDRTELEKARHSNAPGDQPVVKVTGVGKVWGGKLEKAKIRTVADLAGTAPGRVASTLEVSEERAKVLIREAKKLQDR